METLYEITALYSSHITVNLIMFQLFYYYQLWMQSEPKLLAIQPYFAQHFICKLWPKCFYRSKYAATGKNSSLREKQNKTAESCRLKMQRATGILAGSHCRGSQPEGCRGKSLCTKPRGKVCISSAGAPNWWLDLLVHQALLARYSLGMRAALEYSAHQAEWPYLRMRFQMKQSKIKRNFQIIYLT